MKEKPLNFNIEFPRIPGVTQAQAREYILEAVQGWCGQAFEDDDWLIHLQDRRDEVKVRRAKSKTEK